MQSTQDGEQVPETSAQRVNLQEYYAAIKQKQDSDYAENESIRVKRLNQAISDRNQVRSRIDQLLQLSVANRDAGVESSELNNKVPELQRQLEALESLVTASSQPLPRPVDPELDARLRAVEALHAIGHTEACSVSDLSRCAESVRLASSLGVLHHGNEEERPSSTVNVALWHDSHGRLVSCCVHIGTPDAWNRTNQQGVTIRVPVRPGTTPYLRSFLPDELSWLQRPANTPPDVSSFPSVFIESRSGRIAIAFEPKEVFPFTGNDEQDAWQVFKRLKDPGEQPPSNGSDRYWSDYEKRSHEDRHKEWRKQKDAYINARNRAYAAALASTAWSLASQFCKELKAVGGLIDLDADYQTSPLLARVQSELRRLNASTTDFVPRGSIPHSNRAKELVGSHWAAFLATPWSSEIVGPLAILKYSIEKGEEPRFWCERYEGQFGFRLRTRDHTWIVGDLFIRPLVKSEDGPDFELISTESANQVISPSHAFFGTECRARCGSMHMRVVEKRWD